MLERITSIIENISANRPIILSFLVFLLVMLVIMGTSLLVNGTGFYRELDNINNLLVEAHGMLFDLLVIGVLVYWLNALGEKRRRIERYKEEIQDYSEWRRSEAAYRIAGSIRRLNREGVSQLNLSHVYLVEANLSATRLYRSHLREANLGEANLRGADLRSVDLTQANLARATLISADLSQAELSQSSLMAANLSQARLVGANLSEANLYQSTLVKADLRGVNLIGANLRQANLSYAHLRGADLREADLRGADLRGADLRGLFIHFGIPIQFVREYEFINNRITTLDKAAMAGVILWRARYNHQTIWPDRFHPSAAGAILTED